MTAPADDEDEILVWYVTDRRGNVHVYDYEPDDIASVERPARDLFELDFSSLVAFDMANAPDRRVWS